MKKAPLALAMTTVLGGASLGSASAAGVADWVGATGGEWGVATNWSTGQVPGATEQTYIYNDRVALISDSGAYTAESLDLGITNGTSGALQIANGSLTVTDGVYINNGALVVGSGGTTGSLSGNVTNNGLLSFDRSDDVTFGGQISGTGSLVKLGAGTLALTGANTYSGPTNINAGTLQANGGNAIGDNSAVTVAAGATLELVHSGTQTVTSETIGSLAGDGTVLLGPQTFLRAGNDNTSTTFAGSIDGPGGLAKIGTGTLRLTGASTGTGLLTVAEGTLDVAGSTPMRVYAVRPARASGTVTGEGTVGTLVNQGRVVPGNGPGTALTVLGDYTQSASGILVINAEEQAGSGLTATRLNVGGSATFSSPPSTIDVRFDANATIPALEGITVVAADQGLVGTAPYVTLDPASLPHGENFTLDLEATNLGGTFAKPGEAIPAGTGGAGFVVLQVQNKQSLPQVLNAQYLVVNAPVAVPTLAVLTPSQVSTLVPTPTVPYLAPALIKGPAANVTTPVIHTKGKGQTGIVVQNHGVQVGGTVTPQPQSASGTPVSSTGIPVGTGNSVVTVVPPTSVGTTNFVSVTGSYTNVSQTNAQPGTTYRLLYAPHSVDVYKTPASYGNLAPFGTTLTSTQSQVGNALTSLLPEPHARPGTDAEAALVNALYPLSVAQIPGALDSVSGAGTDPTFVTAMNSRLFQAAIEDRLQGYRGSAPTPGLATGNGTGASGARATDLPVSRQLWGIAVGSFGSGDYLQDADLTTGGFVFGADGDLGNGLVAGAALGYAYTAIDPGPGGGADVASLEAAGYAHWTDGPWFATGLAGLGYHWLDIDRRVTVGDVRDTASSSPDGWGVFVAATAGRRFDLDRGVALEPTVGLRYDHVRRDSFTESGAAFADRAVDGESLDAAQAFAGARVYTEVELADGTRLWPEFNVGYAREIGNTDIVTGASLADAPGAAFTVTTEGPGDDVGMVGVRLSGAKGATSFFVEYRAELRSDYTGHVMRAGVSFPF